MSDFVGVVQQPTTTVSVYPTVVIPFPPRYHTLFIHKKHENFKCLPLEILALLFLNRHMEDVTRLHIVGSWWDSFLELSGFPGALLHRRRSLPSVLLGVQLDQVAVCSWTVWLEGEWVWWACTQERQKPWPAPPLLLLPPRRGSGPCPLGGGSSGWTRHRCWLCSAASPCPLYMLFVNKLKLLYAEWLYRLFSTILYICIFLNTGKAFKLAQKYRLYSFLFLCLISENSTDAALKSLVLNMLCSTSLCWNSKFKSTSDLFSRELLECLFTAAQPFGPNSETRSRGAVFLRLIRPEDCRSKPLTSACF